MYSVSDAYRAAMQRPAQEWDLRGTIDGTQFTRGNVVLGSFSISNDCSGQEQIEIGSVTIGVLTATFIGLDIEKYTWRGRKISPEFGLKLADGTFEYIPLGVFTIAKVNHTQTGVEVTAYDAMAALDIPIGVSLSGGVQRNFTLEEFANFRIFSDVTAEAVWEEKICTVSFWVRYSSMTPQPDPVEVPYGSTYTITEANPQSQSYISIGWATAVYGPVIQSVTVTGDMTLYAQDKPVGEYSVLYGGVPEPYRWHVNAGDPFPEPNTPTKTGYTFVKWQLNGVDYDFSTPSSGDIELTAVWTANVTHTVSFMDGSTVLSTQTITHNETASRPADPTRTGVYLSGWVDSREKLYDFSEPVTADISLFASWNETSCTVTFDANGGSVNPASITLGFGGTTGYILPFRTGYICTGWAIENEEMTAYHIAATGCTQCGAELGTLQTGFDENLNGQESLKFQISNSASTWRDVFSWLGELLGGFFTAGRDGKIYLRQFGREFVDNIDASHRWNGCKFGDYEAHFSAVQLSVGQTSYRYALTNDLYACYKIQDNPFIAGEDETSIARRCYNILQMLQAIRYVPFSASLTGNPVYDLADCIRFSGGVADAGKRSCITSFAFRHNAAFQISGAGLGAEDEAETAYNEGTVGPAITPPAITPEELAERDIIRIEWTTPPTKTVYCIGENPAYSGSIITAYFTDGGTANIKDMCILWPPVTYEFTAADVGSYQLKAVKDASSSGNRFECSTDVTVKDVIAEGDWWILRGDGTLYIYQSNYSTRNGPWQQYKDSVTCVIIENGRTVIDYDSFKNYANLTRVEIPNTVTSIGSFVFYGCTSLTDVTLPDGVTSLMGDMFSYCTSLTSITIPDSVTGIYGSNFSYCTSLTSITIPDSVTSIGTYEFSYCTNLASVTLSNNITSIPDYSFMYCASLTSITIPDSVTSVGYVAFSHSGLTSVIIPDSVTNIGSGAFTGCENLANAKISSGITSIGYDTFKQCTSLASITIPSNVTSIGASAFLGCTSLENVEIQSGVTRIYGQAFYGCTSLQSVTIPNGVTKIESSAFKNCINMISATIPNSVTSIGSGAFYGTGITSVTVNSATGVTQGDGRFPNNCTINYY